MNAQKELCDGGLVLASNSSKGMPGNANDSLATSKTTHTVELGSSADSGDLSITPQPARKRKPFWRRLVQFRLRAILALITATCIYLGVRQSEIGDDQLLRGRVEKLGGSVKVVFAKKPTWKARFFRYDFVDVAEIHGTHSRGVDWEIVKSFPNLKKLYLPASDVEDDDLRIFGQLSNLTRLSLWSTRITNKGLAYLAPLSKLTALDIHSTKVTDDGLSVVGQFQTLRVLGLRNLKITDQGLAYLEGLQDLMELDLNATRITDVGMKTVGRLTNLRKLRVNRMVTDEGLAELGGLARLMSLEVNYRTPVTAAGVLKLPNATQPTFQMSNPRQIFSKSKLKDIAQLPWVTQLYLTCTEEEFVYLRELGRLRQLDLRSCQVSSTAMQHLASLKNLQSLFLPMGMTDDGLLYLNDLNQLNRLFVHNTKITAKGLLQLDRKDAIQIVGLEQVLDRSEVSDALKLPYVSRLRIDRPLAASEWKQVAKSGVSSLVIEVPIPKDAIRILAEEPSITKLQLQGIRISRETLAQVNRILWNSDLHIVQCDLTDSRFEGAQELGNVRQLHIGGMDMEPDDLQVFQGMKNLEFLSIQRVVKIQKQTEAEWRRFRNKAKSVLRSGRVSIRASRVNWWPKADHHRSSVFRIDSLF